MESEGMDAAASRAAQPGAREGAPSVGASSETWHVEHAVGRKWRRLGVTFPASAAESDLRAYLAPLAEKYNAARVVLSDGKQTIEVRQGRVDPLGNFRGHYSSRVVYP
jgi:hypothetical protein